MAVLVNKKDALEYLDGDDFQDLVNQVNGYFYEEDHVKFLRIEERDDLIHRHLDNFFNFDTNNDAAYFGLVEVNEERVIENYEDEHAHKCLELPYDSRVFVVERIG